MFLPWVASASLECQWQSADTGRSDWCRDTWLKTMHLISAALTSWKTKYNESRKNGATCKLLCYKRNTRSPGSAWICSGLQWANQEELRAFWHSPQCGVPEILWVSSYRLPVLFDAKTCISQRRTPQPLGDFLPEMFSFFFQTNWGLLLGVMSDSPRSRCDLTHDSTNTDPL